VIPTATSTPPTGGVYLRDDFESGLGQWTPGGNGTASIQSSVTHGGSGALSLTNTSGQFITETASLAGGPQVQTFTRFYVRIASGATTGTIAAGRNASGANQWIILYDQARKGLDVYVWNGARTRFDLYTPVNVIAYDAWYSVELQTTYTASGRVEIWLNGASQDSVAGDLSGTTGVTTVGLWNEVPGTIYMDDVSVASAHS